MSGGLLQKLTEGASILGLFIMGALVQKWTSINVPLVVSTIQKQDGTTEITTVQSILDSLMPGLLPLLLTFACMWLLRNRVNALWLKRAAKALITLYPSLFKPKISNKSKHSIPT